MTPACFSVRVGPAARSISLALGCALLLAPSAHSAKGKKGDKLLAAPAGWPGARTHAVLGVREPSGVAWHPSRQRLYVVGDDGSLAEMGATGEVVWSVMLRGNLEDVAVHPGTGLLVVLAEQEAELIVFDAVARQEKGRVRLDVPALLGRAPDGARSGFEGLCFRPMSGEPGGGRFYLAHQRGPALVVGVAFDPTASTTLGEGDVRERFAPPGVTDLTALTLAPDGASLLAIAESTDRLLQLDFKGVVEREWPLAGLQQEGLAFDGRGTLWVADDRGGAVVELPAAPARLGLPSLRK